MLLLGGGSGEHRRQLIAHGKNALKVRLNTLSVNSRHRFYSH
jgi:predicted branched-subunit amino acid permease